MATNKDFAEYVLDQLGFIGNVSLRPMFGEYGLYLEDKVLGFVCDNTVFLKITPAGQTLLGPDAPTARVTPIPNLTSFWRILRTRRPCERFWSLRINLSRRQSPNASVPRRKAKWLTAASNSVNIFANSWPLQGLWTCVLCSTAIVFIWMA